jgi:hypothetical protein
VDCGVENSLLIRMDIVGSYVISVSASLYPEILAKYHPWRIP